MALPILIVVAALLAQSQSGGDATVVAGASMTVENDAPPTTLEGLLVTPKPATQVEGLLVTPPPRCFDVENASAPAPKVVSTYPAEGQVVRPGLLVFRITFDRPMTCSGFITLLAGFPSPCPQDKQTDAWSADHKTVRTTCLTQPGQTYGVAPGGACWARFVSLDGQRAQPFAVRFSTSDGPQVTSAPEALTEDTGATLPVASADSPANQGLDGTWVGQVTDQFGPRPLFLHVRTDAKGALTATLDSPARKARFEGSNVSGVFELPLERFRRVDQQVEFWLPATSASYAGTLSADGRAIRGRWNQQGEFSTSNFTCPSYVHEVVPFSPPPSACMQIGNNVRCAK